MPRRNVSLLPSAARTSSVSTKNVSTGRDEAGCHVIIDVTAVAATPSVTPTIEAFDLATGTYYPILVGVPITATGKTVLKVGPDIAPLANGAAADVLPATWRVSLAHADADSITYSVSVNMV